MKFSFNNTSADIDVKSISVSHANAIWDEANLSVTDHSFRLNNEENESYNHTVIDSYSFVTEWSVYNDTIKPKYEYKENDFIVEW